VVPGPDHAPAPRRHGPARRGRSGGSGRRTLPEERRGRESPRVPGDPPPERGPLPAVCRPYRGIAEACPVCMASAPRAAENGVPGPSAWAEGPPVDSELPSKPSPEGLDYPVFLDDPT
jgi:hypothetical protein